MRTSSASPRRLHPGVLFCLTILLGFETAASRLAYCADEAPVVVSSDGRTFPQVPMTFTSSPPFAGTGVPEGAPAVIPARPGLRVQGAAGIESVIGVDERKQITDTTVFPYSAIVSLEMTFPSTNQFICTGFLIDADTVATAGHCVYEAAEGGWATSITAYPGRNGNTAPFGSANSTMLFAVSQWTDSEDADFDYGAIKLDTSIGNTAGFLGYGVKSNDAALAGTRVRIFGYPGDKPSGTMWGMPKRIKGVGPHRLFYKADTFGGQSGSPVYGKLSNVCQPCAFGVHAYAVGIEPYPDSNSGTRIDATVFASLAFWATQ